MSDAVVIQWARLGDLLQTRVLLRRLQKTRPAARIILCADARYGDVVRLFPETFEYRPVNLQKWTSLARHSASQGELLRVLSEERDGYQDVREAETLVLMKSAAAATYAELLQPRRQYGYYLRDGELIAPPAMMMIEHALRQGVRFSVHISDMWAAWAGGSTQTEWLPPLQGKNAAAGRSNTTISSIAIFCDAGESHRHLPTAWLARLLRALIERSVSVVLFGVTHGIECDDLMTISASHPSQVRDLRGQTSLGEMIQILRKQHLVIGADSGGVHLAAALGVPVIGLYFGGADCALTGPYAPNAVVIQNPIWDPNHLNAITELALDPSSNLYNTDVAMVSVMRPVLDHYGMLYKSEQYLELNNADAEEFRRLLLQRTPSLRDRDIYGEEQLSADR